MNVRDVFPYGFRHEKVTARRNMPKTRMRIVRKYRIDRIVPPQTERCSSKKVTTPPRVECVDVPDL